MHIVHIALTILRSVTIENNNIRYNWLITNYIRLTDCLNLSLFNVSLTVPKWIHFCASNKVVIARQPCVKWQPFFRVLQIKYLTKCPYFKKPSLLWKIPGYASCVYLKSKTLRVGWFSPSFFSTPFSEYQGIWSKNIFYRPLKQIIQLTYLLL